MALAAAGAVFLTVVLFSFSFRRTPANPVRERVAGLALSRSFEEGTGPTFGERVLQPFFEGMANKITSLLPKGMLDRLKLRLVRAGDPVTPGGFLMICLIAGGVLGGLGLTLAISMTGGLGIKPLGIALIAGAFGAYLPNMWLSNRVKQRQGEIIKSLPDSFDLITTCVEAGLGLDAALTRVSEKVKGAFSDDLAVTLREIGMGRNRVEALHDLADHTGVADLTMFVNAIIQAEQMGTSIGQVLRVQSEQMRTRRRQRAEETAAKAPVKMIFPLVLCILPTLFMVIMGPAAIQLYHSFKG